MSITYRKANNKNKPRDACLSFCLTMLFFTPVKFLCFCVPSSHNCPLKSCSFFWFKRIEQSGRLTKFKRCRWNLCHKGDRTPTIYVIKHLERSLKHLWSICEASLRPPTRKKTCWPLPTGVGKYPNYCLTQHIGRQTITYTIISNRYFFRCVWI